MLLPVTQNENINFVRVMDHFRDIKPVLNKLSKFNVFDTLGVISKYVRAINNGVDRVSIDGIESPEYNSIEIYFADFLIVNSIIYCTELPAKLSLRAVKDRYRIYKPVNDLCNKVNIALSKKEPLVWIVSYIFNQGNINLPGMGLIKFYRYFYLYDSEKIREEVQSIFGFSLEHYLRAALYLYCSFANEHFICTEDYLLQTKFKDVSYIIAIKRILSEISISLYELRQKCKVYMSYESDRIFNYNNDAPHICYPLIKHQDKYFCTVPTYIIASLIDGLYYKLDSPNKPVIHDEFAGNLENYVGLLIAKGLTGHNISYCREITYSDGKQGSLKTSDWILWDDDSLCFLDCKTKRISIRGKRATDIDDNLIDKIIEQQPYTGKAKRNFIDTLSDGITKDLINLGIELGKVFVCFDAFEAGKISELAIDGGKQFYACLVTIEENYTNTPEYKKRVIQIAQSYRDSKQGTHRIIDEKRVRLLSISEFENCMETMSEMGIGKCLDMSPIRDTVNHQHIKDYLFEELQKVLFHPLMNDILH